MIRKCVVLATLSALLVGCWDKEVSRTKVEGSERVFKGTQPCAGPSGYCYACGMTFAGKFECSFAMRWSCPGTQPVTRKVWETRIVYESGKTRAATDSIVVSVDGMCR